MSNIAGRLRAVNRHDIRNASHVLKRCGVILQSLFHAQGSGVLGTALAVASAAGEVIDWVVPETGAHADLLGRGYVLIETSLADFFAERLAASAIPRRSIRTGDDDDATIVFHSIGPEGNRRESVVTVTRSNGNRAVYVLDGRQDDFVDTIGSILWRDGKDIMLNVSAAASSNRRSRTNHLSGSYQAQFHVSSLPDIPKYIGTPDVDWYVSRLRAGSNGGVSRDNGTGVNGTGGHGTQEAHTMLLIGPSGVGKGVLARRIARALSPDRGALKVSSSVIDAIGVADFVSLMEWLRPGALILDDMELDRHYTGERDLALFEALHQRVGLVIGTVMLDELRPQRHAKLAKAKKLLEDIGLTIEAGGDYFPGLRPGRVDEIFRLGRPDPAVRALMLTLFLDGFAVPSDVFDALIVATEGLTGAYIGEVARRIRVHGIATWRAEVADVWRMAPAVDTKKPVKRRKAKRRKKPRVTSSA